MANDGEIDYREIDVEQLRDALRNIDAAQYPINYARLRAELQVRLKAPPGARSTTLALAQVSGAAWAPIPSSPLAARMKRWSTFLFWATLPFAVPVMISNTETQVRLNPVWFVGVPVVVAVIVAAIVGYGFFGVEERKLRNRKREVVSYDPVSWVLLGLSASAITGMAIGFVMRCLLLNIGHAVGGTPQVVQANVIAHRAGGHKQNCRAYSTVSLSAKEEVELCTMLTWRDGLSEVPIEEPAQVMLELRSNPLGTWAYRLRVVGPGDAAKSPAGVVP